MKIITRAVIDMSTMETIEEDSFQYDGPLALCIDADGVTDETDDLGEGVGGVSSDQDMGPSADDQASVAGLVGTSGITAANAAAMGLSGGGSSSGLFSYFAKTTMAFMSNPMFGAIYGMVNQPSGMAVGDFGTDPTEENEVVYDPVKQEVVSVPKAAAPVPVPVYRGPTAAEISRRKAKANADLLAELAKMRADKAAEVKAIQKQKVKEYRAKLDERYGRPDTKVAKPTGSLGTLDVSRPALLGT